MKEKEIIIKKEDGKIIINSDTIGKEPSRSERHRINVLRKKRRDLEQELFNIVQELNEFERKYPFYRG